MNIVLLIIILIWVTILLIGNFWMIRHIYGLNRTLISITIKRDKELNEINTTIRKNKKEATDGLIELQKVDSDLSKTINTKRNKNNNVN